MENPQQILIETQFEGLTLYVRPHETHEWLMETRLVAEGYGVSKNAIQKHFQRNPEEFIPGKHFVTMDNLSIVGAKSNQLFWTKRGVIRLGFFIKSDRARLFRDWAEDLIIRELNKSNQPDKVDLLEAKMHQYLDALYKMFKKDIHNLTQRVDKIDDYLFKPQQLNERVAYVYLMRKLGTNEYKIGKSIEPLGRKKHFERMNIDLEMIHQIKFKNEPTAIAWETTFKKHFAHRNIKGEWFTLSPQDLELFTDIAGVFDRMP